MSGKVRVIPATLTRFSSKPLSAQKKRRVAAYARVSTDEDDQLSSYEAQVSYYSSFIKGNPEWEFVEVYSDEGISGTHTRKREGFLRMIDDAVKNRKIDLILTKSVSRFARNTVDSLSTIRLLKENGVEVYFEKENIYTFDSKGEMLLTIMSSIAQEESRSISENVREIFSLYLTGIGPREISRLLRERGIKGLRGSLMSVNTVTSILRQEKYMGDSILQKTFTVDHITHSKRRNRGERDRYYAEGTHPPIITAETFDEVQAEIERRRNAGSLECNWKIEKSPFTSKVICRECGRTFRRKSSRQKNGMLYCKWTCGERIDRRRGSGCTSSSIPEWALYSLTAEILGKEDFTAEDFDESIDHILGGSYHELTFVMRDGSEITRKWKNRKGAEKCQEK